LGLEPPFPETEQEIAQYREQRLADHYEKHGNPQQDEPTRISSIEELAEYAQEDDVHVKMEPGTYEITTDNAPGITDWLKGPRGHNRGILVHFSGNNSYWDLRDVTIETETRVMGQFAEARGSGPYSHLPDGIHTLDEVMLTARDSIIRGLEYENVHNEEWSVAESTADSARVFNIMGARNLIQDVSITSRGSYPYGYSSFLGKGGGDGNIPLRKKGCIAGGGLENLHVGMEAHARTFGHALGFRDLRNLEFIDCVVDGKIRPTNEIYEETSGPAYEQDFQMKNRDYKIPRGVMISYNEDAFRTYGDHAVSKILNCSVNGTRSGVALAGSSGQTDLFLANNTFTDIPRKNIAVPSNTTILATEADFKYSPAISLGCWCNSVRDVEATLTLLPSETPESITKQFYSFEKLPAANPWPFIAAGITGEGHQVELKAASDDLGKPDAPIVVGHYKWAADVPARNVTLTNRTAQPVILRSDAENCTIKSKGPVEDNGSNNDVQSI
jgi:hypothetical protein